MENGKFIYQKIDLTYLLKYDDYYIPPNKIELF